MQDERGDESLVAPAAQRVHRADDLEGVLAREPLDEDLGALEVERLWTVLRVQGAA